MSPFGGANFIGVWGDFEYFEEIRKQVGYKNSMLQRTLVMKVLCSNNIFFTGLPYAAIKNATCLAKFKIFLINLKILVRVLDHLWLPFNRVESLMI